MVHGVAPHVTDLCEGSAPSVWTTGYVLSFILNVPGCFLLQHSPPPHPTPHLHFSASPVPFSVLTLGQVTEQSVQNTVAKWSLLSGTWVSGLTLYGSSPILSSGDVMDFVLKSACGHREHQTLCAVSKS